MKKIRAANSLATLVYNPPSDPVTQLAEAFAISVAHDNQTRFGVRGDVRGFLSVAINLDHAAAGRPSSPIEGQSALYFAAARAFKYVMLIADHHHGVVPNYLHQSHLSAARYTTHHAYSLPIKVSSSSTTKTSLNGRDPNYPHACVLQMTAKSVSCPVSHTRKRGTRSKNGTNKRVLSERSFLAVMFGPHGGARYLPLLRNFVHSTRSRARGGRPEIFLAASGPLAFCTPRQIDEVRGSAPLGERRFRDVVLGQLS